MKKDIQKRYRLEKKATNNLSKSRLQVKSKDGTFRTVPLKEEIIKIIEKAHNGYEGTTVKHNGIRMTLRNIKGPMMKIYWADMLNDIKNYVGDCGQCVQQLPIKPVKINKIIIANGPFDRFTADLWEIGKEMIQDSGTQYRYVLSCVDHFSKYKWTELICNKEASTITEKFEYFFNFFRSPSILQTDNGREFENLLVRQLCERRNIKIIHGSPYHPQSQGVVEKLNDLISKSLRSSYSAWKKKGIKVNTGT